MKVRVLLDRIDRGNRRLQFAVIAGDPAEETTPEGTRPFVSRTGKTALRREKAAALDAPKKNRKPSPRSPSRAGGKAPLSPASPFAKFGADGSSVRKKSNKERIAAKHKKGKKKR